MIERGKAYEVRSSDVPIGALIIVIVNNMEAFERNEPDQLEVKFENNGALAEDLFTEIVANDEIAKGHNIAFVHHPDSVIVFTADEEEGE